MHKYNMVNPTMIKNKKKYSATRNGMDNWLI